MDALVCGLPRSGTTLVANLMHNPAEKRICLVEPLLNGHSGYLKPRVFDQLSVINRKKIRLQELPLYIPGNHKWAIKECWAERYRYAYEHGKPKMVVFVIRDLFDTMLSSYKFANNKIGVDNKVKAVKEFMEFFRKVEEASKPSVLINQTAKIHPDGRVTSSCQGDNDRPSRFSGIHYSRIGEPETRDQFRRVTGWPLTGDPNRDLEAYGRADEIREGFTPRNENPTYPDEVLEIVNQCQDYQNTFGYNKEASDD